MAQAQSYRVAISDERLADLRTRLSHSTFPSELTGAEWNYGAPLSDIQRLAAHWSAKYDWRRFESYLNTLPNYHIPVAIPRFGSLDIHFLHQRSADPYAIPLLFVHGWPGSYVEVTKMLPLLSKQMNGVSFHIVAPSLPNFGWSEGVSRTGFGLRQYAEACHNLMLSLGYSQYVTQGGDWGFYITRAMGFLFPESVRASHTNFVRPLQGPSWVSQPWNALKHAITPYTSFEKKGLERSTWFATEGQGYRLEQSTKPQTLGYALTDSPLGLLAWIYEKLHDWTDDYHWSDDEICDWVSMYWFSRAGPAASLRIYYEATHPSGPGAVSRDRTQQWISRVPLGLCTTPRELAVVPRTWGRTLGPVVFESQKSKGGHFAAWEVPEEIVKDLTTMFGKGGPCYKVVLIRGSKL